MYTSFLIFTRPRLRDCEKTLGITFGSPLKILANHETVGNNGSIKVDLLLLPSQYKTLGSTDVSKKGGGVDVNITMSTLRRHLKSLELFRQKAKSDMMDVALFLLQQLDKHKIFSNISEILIL